MLIDIETTSQNIIKNKSGLFTVVNNLLNNNTLSDEKLLNLIKSHYNDIVKYDKELQTIYHFCLIKNILCENADCKDDDNAVFEILQNIINNKESILNR